MAWTIELTDIFKNQLKKLDKQIQKRVMTYLQDRLEGCKNPRHFGEPLVGNLAGFWRYRIGDYRVICELEDQVLVVAAIWVGHRREIYKR